MRSKGIDGRRIYGSYAVMASHFKSLPEFAAKAVIQAVADTRQAIWKAVFAEEAAATRLVETQPKNGVRELSSYE
jgi:hypothetical protein